MAEIITSSIGGQSGVEESLKTRRKKIGSGRKRTVNVQLYNNDHEYSRATMKKMKSKKKGRRFENCNYI